MNFSQRIHSSFIILLLCATIISIAGIKAFLRLEPFINTLNSANTKSLYYSEKMLSSISAKKDIEIFEEYLQKSKNNVTEVGEREILDKISDTYLPAFKGNRKVEEETIDKIAQFSHINRIAMERAGKKAKNIERVGIWIILFPSIFIWILGLAILHRLKTTLIKPIQELNNVIFEYHKGNKMRRCPSSTVSKDLQKLYDGINQILDDK